MPIHSSALPILFAAVAALTPATSLAAGSILRVEGDVSIQREGILLPAATGAAIGPGDHVITGQTGKAQMRLQDDSYILVAKNSEFVVDGFSAPRSAANSSPGKAIFSLFKGSLRTITGLIGKGAGDTYQLRTPVATMGVRGTDYAVILCRGNCFRRDGTSFPDGLFVKANQGIVIVTNDGGRIEFSAGVVAYAAASNTRPIIVSESPFDNPEFNLDMQIDLDIDLLIQPPRVEPPASPS